MKKLAVLINALFVSTLVAWVFLDVYQVIKTPLGSINHWIPEYALITLVIYKWKLEKQTRKLWGTFIYIVAWVTIVGTLAGATIAQKLATMTAFLSALWLGLLLGYLKDRGKNEH